MARYLIKDYTHNEDIRTARTLINARKAAIQVFKKDTKGRTGMVTIYDNGFLIEGVYRSHITNPLNKSPLHVEKYYDGNMRKIAGEWILKDDGNLARGI